MTHFTQEALVAPRVVRRPVTARQQQVATRNQFFINFLLVLISIPAAIITIAVLLAMVPFRIPEMFSR